MPPLAPAQPGMWQNCPQSSLIHPYSYLPLGLCPHHFPETVLAQDLVPRTLLSPKFMWLPCHLTLAWSSLSFCKPSSFSGCSPWMSQRLPFLNYLLNSDAPEALCVAFSLPHMLPGPACPHSQLQFQHQPQRCSHLSPQFRPPPVLRPANMSNNPAGISKCLYWRH